MTLPLAGLALLAMVLAAALALVGIIATFVFWRVSGRGRPETKRSLRRWGVGAGAVLLVALAGLWWEQEDPLAPDHGAPRYSSCSGDKETCNVAARYVADHWPDIAPWDDAVPQGFRVGDISWIQCDYVQSDVNSCYTLVVYDERHYGDNVYLHFPEGFGPDGRALGTVIEPLPQEP